MGDIVGQLRDLQTNGDAWAILDLTPAVITEIETLRADIAVALRQATSLLEIFVTENFPPNPDWKPQPDLLGVILQLDNASTIARDYRAEIETLRADLQAAQAALVRQAGIMHRFGDKPHETP
jgi:hypothetical protein